MTTLRRSHAVWLLRHAVALEEAVEQDPTAGSARARAAVLRGIADRLTAALDAAKPLQLSTDERNALLSEARQLAEETARELRRHDERDLAAAEGSLLVVRALLEVAGSAP